MSLIQSIIFNKTVWNTSDARAWLDDHKFKRLKRVDVTRNFLRYRIRDPSIFKKFRILNRRNGIKFVIGFK